MIDQALKYIREVTQDYINEKTLNNGQDSVVLTSFVNDAGQIQIPAETVGLSLLNIEHEKTFRSRERIRTSRAETITEYMAKPIDLNLQVIFTANFSNYEESLKHISYVISCFQFQDVHDGPAIEALGIAKLVMELNAMELQKQHYIWSMIGLRYLPSVIYRLRMLRVQESVVQSEVPNIKTIDVADVVKEVND